MIQANTFIKHHLHNTIDLYIYFTKFYLLYRLFLDIDPRCFYQKKLKYKVNNDALFTSYKDFEIDIVDLAIVIFS